MLSPLRSVIVAVNFIIDYEGTLKVKVKKSKRISVQAKRGFQKKTEVWERRKR